MAKKELEVVKRQVIDRLSLRDGNLLGCHRRNMWEGGNASYRMLRGNALLDLASKHRYMIRGPTGPIDFYVDINGRLLQFRAGSWKSYWVDDMFLLWSIISPHMEIPREITLLWEREGDLEVLEIVVPSREKPEAEVAAAVQSLMSNPPGRLAKNSQRAYHVCRYCPSKLKCDAVDVSRGETQDWGDGYPVS